jgi:hypothetical protein
VELLAQLSHEWESSTAASTGLAPAAVVGDNEPEAAVVVQLGGQAEASAQAAHVGVVDPRP